MLQPSPKSRRASTQSALPAPHERRALSETELAHRWGISPKTLQRWRSEGRGPNYLKLSKRVTYPLDIIVAFEKSTLHVAICERVAK